MISILLGKQLCIYVRSEESHTRGREGNVLGSDHIFSWNNLAACVLLYFQVFCDGIYYFYNQEKRCLLESILCSIPLT